MTHFSSSGCYKCKGVSHKQLVCIQVEHRVHFQIFFSVHTVQTQCNRLQHRDRIFGVNFYEVYKIVVDELLRESAIIFIKWSIIACILL